MEKSERSPLKKSPSPRKPAGRCHCPRRNHMRTSHNLTRETDQFSVRGMAMETTPSPSLPSFPTSPFILHPSHAFLLAPSPLGQRLSTPAAPAPAPLPFFNRVQPIPSLVGLWMSPPRPAEYGSHHSVTSSSWTRTATTP